ncbi:alkaline phosphatase D family protein [Thalassoglobus polymorphus]|nr:alkaline phosphatase D family protein [Thalassoglobus polymorphus]
MTHRFARLLSVIILVSCPAANAAEPVETILFGSCIKQDRPMPILGEMAKQKADAVLFLGDNIYADTHDMKVMREKYATLAKNTDFQALQQHAPIFAVWDDHDYGLNDAGADYPQRVQAQKEFLDFWGIEKDSPRRTREGIYDSVILGPEGKRVQILLLDTRYFRSTLKKSAERRVGGPYIPDSDPAKTILGETQWQWLEGELKKSAEVRIIATGIQCVPSDAGQETWANLPRERQRLFDLISKAKASGAFIVSGDRHWSEFSMTDENVDYPIYDFTSSSFNQIHPRGTPTDNQYRISDSTYHKENYGVIQIDWEKDDPIVEVQIRDINSKIQLRNTLKLSELQARSN